MSVKKKRYHVDLTSIGTKSSKSGKAGKGGRKVTSKSGGGKLPGKGGK
jgi:hypothetical protein